MPFFGFKTSQQPSATSEPKTWPRLMSSSCYRQLRQHNPAQKMARFTVDGYIFRVCSKCASTWAGWDTFAQLTKFRICWRRPQYFDLSGNRFWVEVSHCSLKLNCILPLLYHGQAVFLNERVMSIPYDHYCFHPQEMLSLRFGLHWIWRRTTLWTVRHLNESSRKYSTTVMRC